MGKLILSDKVSDQRQALQLDALDRLTRPRWAKVAAAGIAMCLAGDSETLTWLVTLGPWEFERLARDRFGIHGFRQADYRLMYDWLTRHAIKLGVILPSQMPAR